MRRWSTAILVVLAFGLLPSGSASASPARTIIMLNFVFTPDPGRVQLGGTVNWTNQVFNAHTTTDLSQLALWDSGEIFGGQEFSYTFTAASTYSYSCTLHEWLGMYGTLSVRDQVSPSQGPPGTQFTVKVASIVAPSGFVYDIQKKDPGSQFQDWMTGVTAISEVWDSTGATTGKYSFRSRLRRLSDDVALAYSPAISIQVG